MDSSDDRSNPLGHIRFPQTDYSALAQKILDAQERGSKYLEDFSSYRVPQIDWEGLNRNQKKFAEMVQHAQESGARFQKIIAESSERWGKTEKTMRTLVENIEKSMDFQEKITRSLSVTEAVSDALLRLPDIAEKFSVWQDRIIVKDLAFRSDMDFGVAVEEIVRQDIVLEPVEITLTDVPSSRSSVTQKDVPPTAPSALKKHSRPLHVQHITLSANDVDFFDVLPEGADLIDETIALYETRKAGILLLTQLGWMKETKGVTGQTIRMVQYLRRIGKRPGQTYASLTELAQAFAKRAAVPDTARSSISNRIKRLEDICFQRNCKPIVVKHGQFWKINMELTFWDQTAIKPWVHR
jgi:hypothetical protein